MVRRLKLARGEAVKVWPFETGFKALTEADLAGVEVVVAEVYPSLLKARSRAPARSRTWRRCAPPPSTSPGWTRPASWAPLFGPAKGTAADVVLDAEREEGWILGAGGLERGRGRAASIQNRPSSRPPERKLATTTAQIDADEAHAHRDRQPPGQRHHHHDVAGQVGGGGQPDVAAGPQRLGRHHLQGVGQIATGRTAPAPAPPWPGSPASPV